MAMAVLLSQLKKCHPNLVFSRILLSMIPYLKLNKLIQLLTHQNVKKRLSYIHISMVRNSLKKLIGVKYLSRLGLPCDAEGNFLPPGAPPPPWDYPPPDDYSPFTNRAAFEVADLLLRKDQMSASNINELLQIWASTLPNDEDPPFINKRHLYDTIDQIELGDAPWHSFGVSFNGEVAEGDETPWKQATYDVWYRDPHVVLKNQLKNTDFKNEIDVAPKEVRDENNKRRYCDFMSGDWVWRQCVSIILFLSVQSSKSIPRIYFQMIHKITVQHFVPLF